MSANRAPICGHFNSLPITKDGIVLLGKTRRKKDKLKLSQHRLTWEELKKVMVKKDKGNVTLDC